MTRLGEYILSGDPEWLETKQRASLLNPWFTPEFIDLASKNIAEQFLTKEKLTGWTSSFSIENVQPKKVGIVMAGNIPLVGFHDLLSVFISGHRAVIKPSSKDEALIKHLVKKLEEWEPGIKELISIQEMLKGCDAYIATGSNNSARYFEYYFGKYPHIIRGNRTSVAILDGSESLEDLEKLADDVYLYFGLGCRNVTKLFVPYGYDFRSLLKAFNKYNYLADHQKYKNNYDYNLAILLLNSRYYMSNESILLTENDSIFSPISQLNYEYYMDHEQVEKLLKSNESLQCIVGKKYIAFGQAQHPSLDDFADGVNTLHFLMNL